MAERPEYRLFVDKANNAFGELFADQKFSQKHLPRCINMWANINPAIGYNKGHTHPGALWSGVYYVQTPPECGRVVFQDPRVQAHVLIAEAAADIEPGPE